MKELNTYHDHQEEPKLPDSLRVNPFSVPENYFRDAQSMLMSTLRLDSVKNSTPFSVPEDYFQTLSQQIKAQTVLPLPTENNGMEVPNHYFERLSTQTKSQLAEAKLKETIQDTGFAAPQDYFEQAKNQLLLQVKLENHGANLSENAFEVRPGYFEEFQSRILDRIKTENTDSISSDTLGKVRSINRSIPRWTRILAAASVVVMLSIAIFYGLYNIETPSMSSAFVGEEISLENISDDELANYLAMNNDGLDYLVEHIYQDQSNRDDLSVIDFADQDLEEYIKLMLE